MVECRMFSGTRKEAREKFNAWAKDKKLGDLAIHEKVYCNRDSVAEIGIILIVYFEGEGK